MRRPISIGLTAIGAVLLFYGVSASDSFASEVSEFFSGRPTNEVMWLTIGGAGLLVVGLAGLARGKK